MPQARDEAGNIWEIDAQGNPVRLISPATAGPPADPAFQYQGQKAAADAARARAQADVATSTVDAEIRLANARAAAAQAEANKAIAATGSGSGQTSGQSKVDDEFAKEYVQWQALGGYAGLEENLDLLGRALEIVESSDTISGPVFGRLPKFIQQMVNPASQDVKADVEKVIQQSLKQILGGQFAQKEADQLFARSYDTTQQEDSNADRIRSTLNSLREMGRARNDSMRYFEENGTITGWKPAASERGNPLRTGYGTEGPAPKAAGQGATETVIPPDPQADAEHRAFMQQYIAKGGGDPNEYLTFIAGLRAKYGAAPDVDEGRTYINRVNRHLRDGHDPRNIATGMGPTRRKLSNVERGINEVATSATGTGAINAIDTASFGSLRALAGDGLNAVNELNPGSALAGQVIGSLGATSAIGKLGAKAAGAVAPNLLQGGARAQFGRNLATDATYGGLYGGVSEGDPLSGAAMASLGSAGGQVVGRGISGAIGGVRPSQNVQTLREGGIPLTTGQTLGGFAQTLEDKATSLPLVGDMINARRMEGIEAFNRQAFREAGAPIGFAPQRIAQEGLGDLQGAIGQSYDDATRGAQVPLDQQFANDLTGMDAFVDRLPPDAQAPFNKIGANYMVPIVEQGSLTGETFQNATRALKSKRNKPAAGALGFEQEWKEGITAQQDALRGLIQRGGGQDVVDGLARSDEAYRNMKTLEDAANRGAGGSQSGQTFVFTPSQLQRAGLATEKKYPGPRPLAGLADAGQDVLPNSIPDSGTAGRLAMMAAPGALPAAFAGAGLALDGADGAQTGGLTGALATLALLAGGTKTGQRAINQALTVRPEEFRQAADYLAKRRGLFGTSVAVPALQSQYQ